MSFPDFFFAQDDDGHWYKIPEYIRQEWMAWRDAPEPGADAGEDAWNAFETPPNDAERCEYPFTYTVREV